MNASLSNAHLPEHIVAKMRGVIASHPGIDQAILFGSRAKGNFKPASDIDLALTGSISHGELLQLSFELDDLLLPWEIDLVMLDQIQNTDLRDHIARVGQVFYASLKAAA